MKHQSAIKLHYKHSGSGPVVVILHGLFGSLDNWQSIVKMLSVNFSVYSIDLRNHGKSPHENDFSISLMAGDVIRFIHDHHLGKVNLIGHSLGGKVVLQILNDENRLVDKSMILDIAPKAYPGGHEQIFKAMFSLDFQTLNSRKQADEQIMNEIPDTVVRQFILKNLDRDKNGKFYWKVNLNAIFENYNEINKEILFKNPILNELLFVKGSLSKYILAEDELQITKSFPKAKFVEVEGAGHWIHADKPKELLEIITQFFQDIFIFK